jgi:hypothetical protein
MQLRKTSCHGALAAARKSETRRREPVYVS